MVKCKYFLCLLIGLGLLPCGFAMRPVDSLHLPDSLKTVYETVVDGKEPDMESLIGLVEFLQRKREGYDYGILLKDFLLPMARESASSYYKAYSYYLAGVYFMQKDDFEEALLYYTQALDACQPGKEDMRLKTLEIGYTLPKHLIRFAGLQNVRFYVQGMNLLTFDGLDDVDMDPETKDGDGSWYPVQRIFNFGVDITY